MPDEIIDDESNVEENVETTEETISDKFDFDEDFDVLGDPEKEVEPEVEPEVDDKDDKDGDADEVDDKDKSTETDDKDDKTKNADEVNPFELRIVNLEQALADERATKRIAQEALKDQQKQKDEEVEFDWDNPSKTVSKSAKSVKDYVDAEVQGLRLQLSESNAKNNHEDYDENYALFADAATKNPELARQALKTADPAEAAYQYGKKQKKAAEIAEIGDIGTYKAKIEAEIRAKIEAENKNNNIETKIKKAQEKLPPSAKSLKGQGNNDSDNVVVYDDPLGEMFGDR
jgi:hypothetical protein